MEFSEAVTKRRSVRKFTSEPVPEAVIRKALADALLAPNSSNMQPWEFYWVRSPEPKRKLAEFCMGQPAATTATELVVAVSRIDHWKRNQKLMLEKFSKNPGTPKFALDYYRKLVPFMYFNDPLGVTGLLKRILFFFVGFFKVVPRGPAFRHQLFSMVTKTTALACENFALSIVDQGYGSCTMEGFDESRVKRLLGLGRGAEVVMVFGVGRPAADGIYGEQIRFDSKLFLHEV